jgi:hypothetical protein
MNKYDGPWIVDAGAERRLSTVVLGYVKDAIVRLGEKRF